MKQTLNLFILLFTFSAQAQLEFEIEAVKKLPESINSAYEESCPLFDPVNNRLYFTRTLHPENKGGKDLGQDLWFADFNGENWSDASNELKTLNNYLNNSVIGLSERADRLYLVGTYIRKINLQTGFSYTTREEEDWARPTPLEVQGLNVRSSFYGGFVNRTEDILIISMESNESKGQEDLYISFKTTTGWSKPIWMGDSVNSSGFEISPYLFDDGKTLLFATNGMGGLGDCDIFVSYRKDSTWTNWTTPKNLGKPLNSEKFDAFPFAIGEKLFFASNRNDSLSNIYSAFNSAFYRAADTLRLVFESNQSRMPGIEVAVTDEAGENLGTFTTGRNDIVPITGLKERKTYQLTPSHDAMDINLLKPYVINGKGEYIEALKIDDGGTIAIAPKTASQTETAPKISKPEYVAGMQGVFEVDRIPVRNTILSLRDEQGKVYQYAKTNDQGRFEFAETPDSLRLIIQVLSDLEYVKQNGVIYYTDDKGTKLFKSVSDKEGRFKYQKLEAQEMAQLKALAAVDTKIGAKAIQNTGIFKYENLPQEGVRLLLYDENNVLIEEVITDEKGQFIFTKLNADQSFTIKPANEEMGAGSLVFTDGKGNEINALEAGGFGFKYKPLNREIMTGLRLLEEEDSQTSLTANFVFSIGLFKYKSLPKEGITLRLLDENDNIIETVTTDENGHFVFSMLKPDQQYKVQVVGVEDSQLNESQLYFVDKNGKVTTGILGESQLYTFEQLDPDYFFSIGQINDNETELIITESFKDVVGKFKYQNLAKAGVKLELLDENNKVIETVYTDADGNFIFSKLAKESNYFVRLSEEDAALLDAASFEIKNDNDEPLVQEETDEGFTFKTLPRSGDELAAMGVENDKGLDVGKFLSTNEKVEKSTSKTQGKPVMQASGRTQEVRQSTTDKNDLKLKTLYFNFNSVRLSNYDRFHLNHSVYQKAKTSGQPILIVGYTCDLGSPETNQKVALARAEEAKKYLVSLGMDPNLIEVDGMPPLDGEVMTYGERLENRRIDIYHLAP